jgi:hypothetical protein
MSNVADRIAEIIRQFNLKKGINVPWWYQIELAQAIEAETGEFRTDEHYEDGYTIKGFRIDE